jgi:DNA end-binding protein Ku
MARAIWTGTVAFGLVSVPVRLYPATKRKDVRFHEIDRVTGRRIRHQKVIETDAPAEPVRTAARQGGTGLQPLPPSRFPDIGSATPPSSRAEATTKPVAAADVVKGFEVSKDRYVSVGREEIEELAPARSRTIDVEQFVDSAAIDPIYYDESYYAVPERGHERAFGLLVEAMRETGKIAISWFVLRRKRYLAALRPHGRLMVLATMFYADEIVPTAELEPAPPQDLRKKERETAALLINTLAGPFEPERYPDEFRQRLTALIEGRAASARPAGTAAAPTGGGVQDLMAALQASVEAAKQARLARQSRPAANGRAKSSARRKRKTA